MLPEDSVLSGRTVEQLASGEDPTAILAKQCRKAGAQPGDTTIDDIRPMLATRGEPFSNPAWVYEIKYDGYRLLAGREYGATRLVSRNRHDFTGLFPEIAETVDALPFDDFLLDGEIVVHDNEGLPSFAGLQQRGRLTRETDIQRAAVRWPATFYAFDLLLFDGLDLRSLPLTTRKRLLAGLLPSVGPIRLSEHIDSDGEAMFEKLKDLGLEGMIAKRADSVYTGRRSADWIKVSARTSDDFAVAGFTPPKNRRAGFGALLLAQRGDDGWVYTGHVGGGFTDGDLKTIGERLRHCKDAATPRDAETISGTRWVEPSLVVEVRFKGRTTSGRLRQPTFAGLREDKPVGDCWLPGEDNPLPDAPVEQARSAPSVSVTNAGKVFWPEEGYTKGGWSIITGPWRPGSCPTSLTGHWY